MEFHNVTVDLNSNTYFEGRVTSRNIKFSDVMNELENRTNKSGLIEKKERS